MPTFEYMSSDIGGALGQQVPTSIPDPKYAPKPGKAPNHVLAPDNWAEKEDTVKNALKWCQSYWAFFKKQNARDQAEDLWDEADEMYRVAKTRTKINSNESANVEDTKANVPSTLFYKVISALAASYNTVILGNEEDIPLRYAPLANSDAYQRDEGERVAKYQNALEAYTFEEDDRRMKIRRAVWNALKYADCVCTMEWDRCAEKRVVKEVVEWTTDEDGKRFPKKFAWREREMVDKDNPSLVIWDMKDVWFDAMIRDEQKQNAFIFRSQMQLADAWRLQEQGDFRNVDKVTAKHMYAGENDEGDVLNDRQLNADESGDSDEPTNLLDRFDIWLRAPIDDKGKWNPKKVLPKWHLFTFLGNIDTSAVCVRCIKNPHANGKIPVKVIHSHEDDKGMFTSGHAQRLRSLYAVETTMLNQMLDNVKARHMRPWVIEKGSIMIRDKTFTDDGNRIWYKRVGAENPHQVEVEDTTSITLPMLETVRGYAEETAGTNKPFLGEPLGSRTSASEAKMVFEQALKPALDDAKWLASQLIPWMAEWDFELWKQYGDPDRTYSITFEGQQLEILPGNIWGPLKVRVTSIKHFQDSVIQQQIFNQFMSTVFPMAKEIMSEEGQKKIFTQIMKTWEMEDVDGVWRTLPPFDPRSVALDESAAMLYQGVDDIPKPDEDHEQHLKIHEGEHAAYKSLPPDEQVRENVAKHMLHITEHRRFLAMAGRQIAGQSQETGAEGTAPMPRSEGEVMGDMAGALENPSPGVPSDQETPIERGVGRPTEFQGVA